MLNLGTVRFDIVVETSSLRQAQKRIKELDDQIKRLLKEGDISRVESEIGRQKTISDKLFKGIQVLDQIREAPLADSTRKRLIEEVENSMAKLANTLTDQEAGFVDVKKAVNDYELSLKRVKRDLKQPLADQKKFAQILKLEGISKNIDDEIALTVKRIRQAPISRELKRKMVRDLKEAKEYVKQYSKGVMEGALSPELFQSALTFFKSTTKSINTQIAQEQKRLADNIRNDQRRLSLELRRKDIGARFRDVYFGAKRSEAPREFLRDIARERSNILRMIREAQDPREIDRAFRLANARLNKFKRNLLDIQNARRKAWINQRDEFFRKKEIVNQEKAIRRLTQTVLDANAAIERANAPKEWAMQNKQALSEFIKRVREGNLDVVQFAREYDRVIARVKDSRRRLSRFRAVGYDEATQTGRLAKAIRDLQSASVLAVGPLSGLGARVQALGAIVNRSSVGIAAMAGTVAGLTMGLILLARGMTRAASEMEGYLMMLDAVTQDTKVSAAMLGDLIRMSDKYGISLQGVAKQYGSFMIAAKSSGIAFEEALELFRNLVKATAGLRMRPEQVQGTFRAITQMMSKGKVTAEELTQQLSEFIPGAFKMMADAAGVTTRELAELMQRGEVLAKDTLPQLGRVLNEAFGTQAERNVNTLTGAQERLNTALTVFLFRLDLAFRWSTVQIGAMNKLADGLNWVGDNLVRILSTAGAAGGTLLSIVGALMALKLAAWLKDIATSGRLARASIEGISKAMRLFMRNGKAVLFVLGALAIALAVYPRLYKKIEESIKDNLDSWSNFEAAIRKLWGAIEEGPLTGVVEDKLEGIRNEIHTLINDILRLQTEFDDLVKTNVTGWNPTIGNVSGFDRLLKIQDFLKGLGEEDIKRLNEELKEFDDSLPRAAASYIQSIEASGRITEATAARLNRLLTAKEQLQQLNKYMEENISSAEKYGRTITQLNELRMFVRDWITDLDDQRVAFEALDQAAQRAYRNFIRSNRTAMTLANLVTDSFINAAMSVKELDAQMQVFLDNLEQGIKRMALEFLLREPLQMFFGNLLQGINLQRNYGTPAGYDSSPPVQDGVTMIGLLRAPQEREAAVRVQVIDQRTNSAPLPEVSFDTAQDGTGFIRVLVRDEVRRAIGDGFLDRDMAFAYGIRRQTR